jgi:ATP:cob(I)alamin adenosyltransferase
VLPAGSPASAALHLARTVCRRAERKVVELMASDGEIVGEPALKYLNRLSDLLFVAARARQRRRRGPTCCGSRARRGRAPCGTSPDFATFRRASTSTQ